MQKAKLRKLRSLPATPAIVKHAKEQVTRTQTYCYSGVKHSWKEPKYKVLARCQNLDGFLKIAIFIPDDLKKDILTPRFEVFLNVKGREYITRELDAEGKEKRWLTAMVKNLPGMPWWGNRNVYVTQDTHWTLNSQLVIDREPRVSDGKCSNEYKLCMDLDRLDDWQQQIKDEETRAKEAKEVAPWDEDMNLIGETPEGFMEWMRKDCCKDFYMFYEYKAGGAKEGYCSRCKKTVPIVDPRHNMPSRCPKCEAKGLFKSIGKSWNLATDTCFGQMTQKIKGGIVVRQYTQKQSYFKKNGVANFMNPRIDTHEYVRVIIPKKGPTRVYAWDSYKNKCMRWVRSQITEYYGTYYWDKNMPLYKRNFYAVKNSDLFRQSAIDLWPELPCSVTAYLQIEKGNPAVEMLAKIGMFRLAKSLIKSSYDKSLLDQNATEIAKMLKVDNARLKRLKAMDADIKHLKWMQTEKFTNTIWPDEMIKRLGNVGLVPSDFYFLKTPLNHQKAYNYLAKQAEMMGFVNLYNVFITWRDYIRMADQLKMDISLERIERPKDLKAAHDECIMLKESKGIEKEAAGLRKKWKKAEKNLKKLEKFEYKKSDYQIIAPKKLEDIVREGRILKHCVHTCDFYFERIQTDESYLFFLRKATKPDMPWYTLEVESSGNIRQKRTTGDNQNKDLEAAVGFLKDWQKFFRKQLTKKEKEQGDKANELRKKNYAELRKKQSKVWHGKLAGQLLADVLEADFMEAAGI